jgi:hypothetical protein
MAAETVASRYNRDWLQLNDDRKVRGFDQQGDDVSTGDPRWHREYVDPATGNTVATTGDNPA